jgi:hypothetical protein
MASVLKVDKLDPQSGTALEIGTSGDTISVPSGATLDISASTLTPPATMPASSGVNLTALNATQLTSGTVPAARLSGLGKVLQVVTTAGAHITDTSSTSPSTNIYVTIVPTLDTSKILVIYAPPTTNYLSQQTNYGHVTLNREVSGGADTNITTAGHNSSWGLLSAKGTGVTTMSGSAITFLDDPTTTTSLDYKIRVWVDNTALNMIIGHSSGQPCMSSITAIEIGA